MQSGWNSLFFVDKSSILKSSATNVIEKNIQIVRGRIAEACRRADRDPGGVTLVAVSKLFDAARIAEARRCGQLDFGENYIQELRGKREALAGDDIRWHFIGHLQTNKVKHVADWIHLVHAVDSVRLASALSAAAAKAGRTVPVLIEVNTTAEVSKFGCPPEKTPQFARELQAFPNIRLEGLMTMGPLAERPEDSRPAFRTLRRLRDEIRADGIGLPQLSMGMTGDFEVAIEEGATILRVGTAIFGPRTAAAH